ncbi:MAG: relaxase domain-containing protein, partial [Pseudonocardia sp.]|nr:relaxase domain-containing protein [Pseudonocardia sp.]
LHVHGPILNKVLCADGKWRAIDGNLITRWKDAASALGRVTEAYVHQQLGLLWRTNPDGTAREIVGVGHRVDRAVLQTTRRDHPRRGGPDRAVPGRGRAGAVRQGTQRAV